MKFILGFFIGLLTGVTIILGPLIAVFVSLGLSSSSDEPTDDPNVPEVQYRGMSQHTTPEEPLS